MQKCIEYKYLICYIKYNIKYHTNIFLYSFYIKFRIK